MPADADDACEEGLLVEGEEDAFEDLGGGECLVHCASEVHTAVVVWKGLTWAVEAGLTSCAVLGMPILDLGSVAFPSCPLAAISGRDEAFSAQGSAAHHRQLRVVPGVLLVPGSHLCFPSATG